MDLDFNPRIENCLCENVLLDSCDASSTTFVSSLEHFRSKLNSQSAGHTIEKPHQCPPIDSLMTPKTISGLMTEICDSEVSETHVFMKSDGFSNGIDLMSAPIPISSNQSDKGYSETSVSMMYYPKDDSNIFGLVKGVLSEIHNSSVSASNGQIQKTLSHFAPNPYPLMLNNRLESVTIESASLTTIINVQTLNNATSDCDSISSMDCIHLENSCNNKFGDSNKSATISTNESSPIFSIPDSEQLNEFLYGNLEFPMFLGSGFQDEKLDTFDYPSLHEDSNSVADKNVADLSDSEWKGQLNNREYDKKILETPGLLVGLENGSSSGDYKEMEISNSSNIEPLYMHWTTEVDSSSFDVSDHEELLESYGFNSQDQTIVVGYTCTSPTWPGKEDAAWKEGNQMNLTDLASNEDSPACFYDENSNSSVSLTHLEQRKCALNTSTHVDNSEDYLSQGHLSNDEFENPIEEPISGTSEKSLVYAIPDPDTVGDFLFGNLDSPTFLAAELQDNKFDILDSPFRASCSDDSADAAIPSDKCNVELLDSDSICKNPSAFPFDFNDDYEFLETYGLNEQDQYTDDLICESPTWPGKV